MKKLFALLFFVFISIVSFCQNNYQDVVYLKDGSIIRGTIIEQVPYKLIKIETTDRCVFVCKIDDIEKLTKETIQFKKKIILDNSGLKPGYKGIVELGYQIGMGEYGLDRLKFNLVNGYQINPYFSVGIGTGLRYYFNSKAALIPVFSDFRANFMDNKVSPFLSLGFGYSFNASNNFKGIGILLNPSAGVSFKVSNKSSVNIGIGYEIQRMDFYPYNYYEIYFITKNSGAISINAGISF